MSEDNNILFQRFLSGELSDKETIDFNATLKSDPAFRSAFEMYQLLEGHLEEKVKYGEAVGVLKEVGERRRSEGGQITLKKKYQLKYILSVAAISTLLIFVLNKAFFSANDILTHNDIYLSPAWGLDRSKNNKILQNSKQLLISKELSKSITLLEKSNIQIDSINYWKAEYYLYANKPDSSLLYLQKNKPFKFALERLMYLNIIVEYELQNYKEVKKLLNNLPSDVDKSYKKIYNKIEKSIN